MAPAWPEPVQGVSRFLQGAGAEARVEEFPTGTPTATAAADAIGCTLGQIVKTLVLVSDGAYVAALVPGDRRGDLGKVAALTGARRCRVATSAEVEEASGFAPGAVAPFPLPRLERVFADRSLLQYPLVWAGAGSDRHMVALTPAELVRLSRAEVVDVAGEPAYDSQPGERTKEP